MENNNRKIKYVYSDEAKKLIPEYQEAIKENFQQDILDEKYVFGDDAIEITASDIKNAIGNIRSRRFFKVDQNSLNSKRKTKNKLFLLSYAIVGALLTLIGIFFPFLREILIVQPQRGMLVFTGVAMISISALLSTFLKNREINRKKKNNENLIQEFNLNFANQKFSQLNNQDMGTGEKISSLKANEPSSHE